MAIVECEVCGLVFEASRSDAKYCSTSCRKKAYRKRAKQPLVPESRPAPLPSASFDDVADAVDDARAVSNRFAQLSSTAPRPLRAGCSRIGQAITRAIESEEW